jgi:undecaprenyl-diphosphatase
LGAVVAITLGVVFAGQAGGSDIDGRVTAALELPQTLSSAAHVVCWIVQTAADPVPAAVFVLLLVVVCLRWRRPRLAFLAVVGPATADVIVIVTKHLVGRTIHNGNLTYPSTHTTQSVAFSMVVALLAAALLDLEGGAAAALVLSAAAAAALVMGWALVAGSVHYATDALAGLCLALAVLPAVARCTDLVADRLSADRRIRTMRPL